MRSTNGFCYAARSMRALLLLLLASCGAAATAPRNPPAPAPLSRELLETGVTPDGAPERGRNLRRLAEDLHRRASPSLEELRLLAEIHEALGETAEAVAVLDAAWKQDPTVDLLVHRTVLRAAALRPANSVLLPLLKRDLAYPPLFSPLSPPELSREESEHVVAEFREAYELLSQTQESDALALIDLSKQFVSRKFRDVVTAAAPLRKHPAYGPRACRLQALAALACGETATALDAARELRTRHPVLAESFLIEGLALLVEGDREKSRPPILIAAGLGHPAAGDAALYLEYKTGRVTLTTYRDDRSHRFLHALIHTTRRPEHAILAAGEFAKEHPDRMIGLLGRGWILHRCEKFEEALNDLDEAVRQFPDRFEPVATRGIVYFSRGLYEEAALDLRSADRLRPDDLQILYPFSIALFRTNRLPESEECLTKALQILPDRIPFLLQRARVRAERSDAEGAREDADTVRRLDPENRDVDLVEAGLHLSARRFDRAEALLDRILSENAASEDALLLRGLTRFQQGRHERALADFFDVLRLRPDHVRALEYLALCRMETGDPTGALDDLARAIELSPKSPRLFRIRGTLRAKLGSPSDAAADLERAIELEPTWRDELDPLLKELRKQE